MTQLRERSHIILWLLLFFFIASMTVGGLVGGANIMGLIFGGRNIQLNAGKVGNENIPHNRYLRQREIQLNQMRNQGREIDNRAYQNAGDFAWNSIIERELKNEKIKQLGLEVNLDEIYDFLFLTPPVNFQNNLMTAGYFSDEEGSFDSDSYREAVQNGAIPIELNPLLVNWENSLRVWLADRKLQSLYNNLGSVSDERIKTEFIKKNQNCTIDYIYLTISSIPDSLIEISDEQIKELYEQTKDESYSTKETRSAVYALFKPQPATNIKIGNVYIARDTLDAVSKQDQALQDALLFAEEAEYSSFAEALSMYGAEANDTLNIQEGFELNSGIPFQMGVLRPAVRFAFDNSIGSISDPITAQNGTAVFHTLGEKEAGYRPLNEVKENIRRTLFRDNKKEFAVELLQNKTAGMNDWETLANSDTLLQYKSGETQTLGGSFPGIGKSNQLGGTLLAMEPDEISGTVETFNAALILRMISKNEIDDSTFQAEYDIIRDQLLTTERNQGFSNWLTGAKKSVNQEDYRSQVY